ncbi:hypothetical protein [Erythrobacter crassostreae]|uniref:Uncharacterized protein n=1 Tax=Erythrobacter crassostreae TaxID=2828328 RepID=A0A9X1JPY8_9SPHN|nr:hypothetical protein [Erythrobacter crassostrea]MBV7259927.1 hypothetical protein [Erythrobacter crassostrea]
MAQMPLPKAHELFSIIQTLEQQLKRLDEIGSGIGAVHVNAAIEQLQSNLAVVNDNDLGSFDPALICLIPEAQTGPSKPKFGSTRD